MTIDDLKRINRNGINNKIVAYKLDKDRNDQIEYRRMTLIEQIAISAFMLFVAYGWYSIWETTFGPLVQGQLGQNGGKEFLIGLLVVGELAAIDGALAAFNTGYIDLIAKFIKLIFWISAWMARKLLRTIKTIKSGSDLDVHSNMDDIK